MSELGKFYKSTSPSRSGSSWRRQSRRTKKPIGRWRPAFCRRISQSTTSLKTRKGHFILWLRVWSWRRIASSRWAKRLQRCMPISIIRSIFLVRCTKNNKQTTNTSKKKSRKIWTSFRSALTANFSAITTPSTLWKSRQASPPYLEARQPTDLQSRCSSTWTHSNGCRNLSSQLIV